MDNRSEEAKKDFETNRDALRDSFGGDFYNWMYTAYWLSNSSADDKCKALV